MSSFNRHICAVPQKVEGQNTPENSHLRHNVALQLQGLSFSAPVFNTPDDGHTWSVGVLSLRRQRSSGLHTWLPMSHPKGCLGWSAFSASVARGNQEHHLRLFEG